MRSFATIFSVGPMIAPRRRKRDAAADVWRHESRSPPQAPARPYAEDVHRVFRHRSVAQRVAFRSGTVAKISRFGSREGHGAVSCERVVGIALSTPCTLVRPAVHDAGSQDGSTI